jgi:hypothetical protein
MPVTPPVLIKKHGGYRKLASFMMATIIYYGTVSFCRRFVKSMRQTDQMVQAAGGYENYVGWEPPFEERRFPNPPSNLFVP